MANPVILSAIFCTFSLVAFAQVPFGIQWQQSFGGSSNDFVRVVKATSDGGYVIGGESNSNPSGNKTNVIHGFYDYWIVKVDSENNKQWEAAFGGDGFEQLSAIEQCSDGGYILGGFSDSSVSGSKTNSGFGGYDYWVIKINSAGVKLWEKSFGGSGGDYLFGLQQTADGGYILGGQSGSSPSGNKTNVNFGNFDFWIVKLDGDGNKQWEKVYGGSSEDYFSSIQQTSDGGYILGGGSRSPVSGNKTSAAFGNFDFWIVKLDFNGNKQWDKSFGGVGNDDFSVVRQTIDGGYILGGYSSSGNSGNKTDAGFGLTDFWIAKLEADGTKIWDRCYGGTNNESLYSLQQTSEGGYILGGSSHSGSSGNKLAPAFGLQDYWIVKTDAVGNRLWDEAFGGSNSDALLSLDLTLDGGFFLAGRSQSGVSGNKTTSTFGEFDFWTLKVGTPLQFKLLPLAPNNGFEAKLIGNSATDYIFQVSTNLLHWTPFLTNNSTNGVIFFSHTNPPIFPHRFYRAKEHP